MYPVFLALNYEHIMSILTLNDVQSLICFSLVNKIQIYWNLVVKYCMFKVSFVLCCFEGKEGEKKTKKDKSPQKTTFKIQKFINMHFLEEIEMTNMCMKNAYPHNEQKEM